MVNYIYSSGVYHEQKQKIYTIEFKTEAIKAIEENNGNVSGTARQLGISMQTLSNWYNKAKFGTLVGTQQYPPNLEALLEENKRGCSRLALY